MVVGGEQNQRGWFMGIQIPFARMRYLPGSLLIGLSIGEARVNNTFRSDYIIYWGYQSVILYQY